MTRSQNNFSKCQMILQLSCTQNSCVVKIMNVNWNQHAYNKKRNEDTKVMSDAIINKLLEKYNINKVTENVGVNVPVKRNNTDNRLFGKERTMDPSKTPDTLCKPNIRDILQKHSMNYDGNENNNCDRSSEDLDCNDLNNIQDNCGFYQDKLKKHFENKRNLEANLAFLKSKVTFRNNNNENTEQVNQNRELHSNNSYAEKTTYCRPVVNIYNQEFICKTLDRNAKLQALVKKLILARRREKEKEEWNNYVNELKNKHNCYDIRPRHIMPPQVPQERFFPESNDIYKINAMPPDRHITNDFHTYEDAPLHDYCYPVKHEMSGEGSRYGYLYENDLYCYPTASQGRMMMLQRERARRNLNDVKPHLPPYRSTYLRPHIIYVDRDPYGKNRYVEDAITEPDEDVEASATLCKSTITKPINLNSNITTDQFLIQDSAVQTEQSDTCLKLGETTKEKYEKVTENVNRLKAQIESNEQKIQRQNSLWKIESKLDVLVKSIKHLMADLRIKSSSTTLSSVNFVVTKPETDIEQGSSESPAQQLNARKTEAMIVGHVDTNTSTTAFQSFPNKLRHFQPSTRIDNIICEELDKSNKLRQELGKLLHTQTRQNHSVQITVDIPTRECATEVTDSLSRAVLSDKEIEESLEEQDSQITIAVNTDPLGLLTLLTMSTDVVKQLISFVPTVDYGWYLSRLPLPQLSGRSVTDFVCNICGAAFARPSQLSDHMKNHDFGDTKDCCVCRHALDLRRRRPGLFTCRYCGQRYTRAYCCELHQQSCARALGFAHDVASSLALLR